MKTGQNSHPPSSPPRTPSMRGNLSPLKPEHLSHKTHHNPTERHAQKYTKGSGQSPSRMAPLMSSLHYQPEIFISSFDTNKIKAVPKDVERCMKKKCVSFHDFVSVRHTIHIKNYSDDEVNACWYTRHEVKKIRENARHIAKLLETGTLTKLQNDDGPNTEDYNCTRGIENLTRTNLMQRQKIRMAAWFAVFDEQDQQDEQYGEHFSTNHDWYDSEHIIAQLYKQAPGAASNQRRAYEIALRDHLDVMEKKVPIS